jgi:hypothetical protein
MLHTYIHTYIRVEGNSYFANEYQKQTPWPLVRERTIPTERPPLVDEILVPTTHLLITPL